MKPVRIYKQLTDTNNFFKLTKQSSSVESPWSKDTFPSENHCSDNSKMSSPVIFSSFKSDEIGILQISVSCKTNNEGYIVLIKCYVYLI